MNPVSLRWRRRVRPTAGAEDIVQLDQNHPGFRDPEYRSRRNHRAAGAPLAPRRSVPEVQYTETEQGVWRTVWEHLAPLHSRHASAEYKVCSQGSASLASASPSSAR
jgi:phenylalanine-4-hydroxylase